MAFKHSYSKMYSNKNNSYIKEWFDKNYIEYAEKCCKYIIINRYERVRKYFKGEVLDVGMGHGIGYTSRNNKNITGFDISDNMLKIAKDKRFKKLICGDAENLPFKENSFDTIICSETLYFLKNPEKFIRKAKIVLKAEGKLIIVGNRPFWRLIDLRFFSKIRSKYKLGNSFEPVRNDLSPIKILKLLRKEDYGIIEYKGFQTIPIPSRKLKFLVDFLDKTFLNNISYAYYIAAAKNG